METFYHGFTESIIDDISSIMESNFLWWENVVSIEVRVVNEDSDKGEEKETYRLSVDKFKKMAEGISTCKALRKEEHMTLKNITIYFDNGNYMFTDVDYVIEFNRFKQGWTFVDLPKPNLSLKEDEGKLDSLLWSDDGGKG